jgi:hypothetical protein
MVRLTNSIKESVLARVSVPVSVNSNQYEGEKKGVGHLFRR